MAWAPVKDAGAVTRFHGGIVLFKQCLASGAVDSSTSWVDFGHYFLMCDDSPFKQVNKTHSDSV